MTPLIKSIQATEHLSDEMIRCNGLLYAIKSEMQNSTSKYDSLVPYFTETALQLIMKDRGLLFRDAKKAVIDGSAAAASVFLYRAKKDGIKLLEHPDTFSDYTYCMGVTSGLIGETIVREGLDAKARGYDSSGGAIIGGKKRR